MKPIIFFLFAFFLNGTVFAQSGYSPAVKKLINSGLSLASAEKTIAYFSQEIPKLSAVQDRKSGFLFFANYLRLYGKNEEALLRYKEAAFLSEGKERIKHLLDAAQSAMASDKTEEAHEILQELSDICTAGSADHSKVLLYQALLDIQTAANAEEFSAALQKIQAYASKKSFAAYHSILLFTLWWINGDAAVKEKLVKQFPKSMEAAAVSGSVDISPSVFWYLMPRNPDMIKKFLSETTTYTDSQYTQARAIAEKFRETPATKQEEAAISIPKGYQLGFFKDKANAEKLLTELQKKGFTAKIQKETRASGTIYYQLFTPEDAKGSIGLKLKAAGYETFPIF
ncbi:SPOR domain-containing protein [Treponema phagedenis]|uniref:Sporulation and cell division repeat protein n=1 Tax=Treponema phagedenis TaxID=162 RepID=A0A0B7H0G2_TREPH|nr:SPOR domain-containing protein [Treponema phagedenis]NVP24672.1 SPOR domain-containing protein [Treponema phagedenis]QEJ95691.1 SPOR domain-containing protein [Treponema phagedenis]QEK03144.1 SPOR domain-containing protein [Treponema phagedenis]QEK08770.1 SPOR domain-containing protein [Treponema phagedenis]QKS92908.1 SPOR domain-containing protein [Treponema phagedenis]